MPQRNRSEQLMQQLQTWPDAELSELVAMLQGLLEARQSAAATAVTTETEPATGVAAHPADDPQLGGLPPLGKHGGRGHIELKLIPDAKTGKTYGPYRYLRYWGMTRTGRMGLKSLYLGKAEPP